MDLGEQQRIIIITFCLCVCVYMKMLNMHIFYICKEIGLPMPKLGIY